MKISQLEDRLDPELVEKLKEMNIVELNPPQKMAVEMGLLEKESLLISSPTASGKTLIAAFGIHQTLLEPKKSIYVVPLRSLAQEKYRQFCYFFGRERVGVSTGEYESDSFLSKKDILILTVEKLDSMLRHGISWMGQIGLVVFDEIHLLNDPNRGPTLELVITKLKAAIDFQLLGLSATVKNSQELADWLQCKLLESDYRPVKLKEGVLFQNNLDFGENENNSSLGFMRAGNLDSRVSFPNLHGDDILNFIQNLIDQEKQGIVFVNSRRSAESLAKKIAHILPKDLELDKTSKSVLNALSRPTQQCEVLSNVVNHKVAFHHAGLIHKQKTILEESFLKGDLKFIIATPTLAMGVSLPSYAVLIRDVKRFGNYGMDYIPVMEYKQMSGRAGRPEYHESGIAIAYAPTEVVKNEIKRKYIYGDVEDIYSKLAVEPVLRFHLLGLISSSSGMTQEEIFAFFSKTFYFHQYGDEDKFKGMITRLLDRLNDYGFIDFQGEEYTTTALGKRTSELYLDPETALKFLICLSKPKSEFGCLYVLSDSLEIRPHFSVRKKDHELLNSYLDEISEDLSVPDEWDYHFDDFLRTLKTSVVLKEWMDEQTDDNLLKNYGVTPGILRGKIELAEWLLYGMRELARTQSLKEGYSMAEKLRRRIRYGVKEELLPLVKIRGIGRVRARSLYNKGFRNSQDLLKANEAVLSSVVGPTNAQKILSQLKRS